MSAYEDGFEEGQGDLREEMRELRGTLERARHNNAPELVGRVWEVRRYITRLATLDRRERQLGAYALVARLGLSLRLFDLRAETPEGAWGAVLEAMDLPEQRANELLQVGAWIDAGGDGVVSRVRVSAAETDGHGPEGDDGRDTPELMEKLLKDMEAGNLRSWKNLKDAGKKHAKACRGLTPREQEPESGSEAADEPPAPKPAPKPAGGRAVQMEMIGADAPTAPQEPEPAKPPAKQAPAGQVPGLVGTASEPKAGPSLSERTAAVAQVRSEVVSELWKHRDTLTPGMKGEKEYGKRVAEVVREALIDRMGAELVACEAVLSVKVHVHLKDVADPSGEVPL